MIVFLLPLLIPAVTAITAWEPVTVYMGVYKTYRLSSFDDRTRTYTRTSTVSLTATSLPATVTPFSSSTSVQRYDDITIIEKYVSLDQMAKPWPTTTSSSGASTMATEYYVQSILTAPPYCTGALATTWTHTTSSYFYPPMAVRNQLKPISTITTAGRYVYSGTTTVRLILSENAVVKRTSKSTNARPTDSYGSTRSCSSPSSTPTGRGGYSSRYGGGSGDSALDTEVLWYGSRLTVRGVVTIVCSIIAGLFVLGFLENFFWFRRLMRGESALRLGTVCWVLISLWAICLIRHEKARPDAEHRKVLRERWTAMSGGTKWKLWWKWGFKWQYPQQLLQINPTVHVDPSKMEAGGDATNETPPIYSYYPPPGPPPAAGVLPQSVVGPIDNATDLIQQQPQTYTQYPPQPQGNDPAIYAPPPPSSSTWTPTPPPPASSTWAAPPLPPPAASSSQPQGGPEVPQPGQQTYYSPPPGPPPPNVASNNTSSTRNGSTAAPDHGYTDNGPRH